MARKTLVIGATGTVGAHVVGRLVEAGEEVVAATRDPARASGRLDPGVTVALLDLEQPVTFAGAFEGVDRVFLIARPGDDHPETVAIPLIKSMAAAGVRHVVNMSAMGAESREDFGLRKVERHLEASGLGYTYLRPNFFMQIFSSGPLREGLVASGALHVPADGAKVSYVDVRDIAEVAVAALRDGESHAGRAYTLTGDRALDLHEVAASLSTAAGRAFRYVPIDEPAARAAIAAAGLPPERVERLIGFYRLVRSGFCTSVSGDLQSVLRRPPTPFDRFAADHSACWA